MDGLELSDPPEHPLSVSVQVAYVTGVHTVLNVLVSVLCILHTVRTYSTILAARITFARPLFANLRN